MARDGHIDIETLDAYLLGKLGEAEAEAARRHLEGCVLCGLELKRLQRFAAVDSDEDLARSAEWIYARRKLENAYRDKIAPAAAEEPGERRSRIPRGARALGWLIPAAVMAAGLVIIGIFSKQGESPVSESARRVMRGAPPVRYEIELVEPAGEIAAAPAAFRWRSERGDDRYTLEIFTPTLSRIYQASNVTGTSWIAPDSLRAAIKPNIVYLWSVRGYRGLERASVSPNGWFKIARKPMIPK
jgi:hypothetical protein